MRKWGRTRARCVVISSLYLKFLLRRILQKKGVAYVGH